MSSARTVTEIMTQAAARLAHPLRIHPTTPIRVGVDLGTAFTVITVTDQTGRPLACANRFADVVRDGVVWDFAGAVDVVRSLKRRIEAVTGRKLTAGAVTIPPAVTGSDHRAHRYVLEGVGIECTAVVDEPTAANAVLGISDGAVVDIGGGTTGVAILRDGKVVQTIDEPTGGTHLSLVISGAYRISFEEAERRKVDPSRHPELLPVVRPVLEKVATIVADAVAGHDVHQIHLVGGTSSFTGVADIVAGITGIPTHVAPEPMLVTPLGVAKWAQSITEPKPEF
jgi:ethanolamine utilization protein EutJ